jgi:hypothetical protein
MSKGRRNDLLAVTQGHLAVAEVTRPLLSRFPAYIIPLGSTACQRRTEFHVFTSALAKGDSSSLNSRKNGAERHVAYKSACNFFCYRNNLVSVWLESYPSPKLALQQQLAARLVGRI